MSNKLSHVAPYAQNFRDYMGNVKPELSTVSMETFYLQDPNTGNNTMHPYALENGLHWGISECSMKAEGAVPLISGEENESTEKYIWN